MPQTHTPSSPATGRQLPWNHPLTLICTWFCSGKIPFAPGTWGSFFTLPIPIALVIALGINPLSFIILGIILIILFVAGTLATHYYMKATGTHDASEIVIDEVVGMLIVMLSCSKLLVISYLESPLFGCGMLGAIFIAFRIFDILKPFPIGWCDKHIHGAFGVMFDDVLAGVFASITLHILFTLLAHTLVNGHLPGF